MKKNYLKTLLLATMFVVGAYTSLAQTTSTIYERTDVSAWSASDITSATTVGYWTPSSSSGTLWGTFIDPTNGLKSFSRGNTVNSVLTLNRAANTMVTIDAVWNTGSSTYPSSSNSTSFKYGDFTITNLTRYNGTSITINGQNIALANVLNNTDVNIHLVVNSVNGQISEATGTLTDNTVLFDMTKLGTNTTFATGSNYETITLGSYCSVSKNNTSTFLKSLKVQQTTQDVATANYTVNFATSDGTIVRTETRNGPVGNAIVPYSTDKNAFFDAVDNTIKYLYVSDDSNGKTIVDNSTSTTVVTITVRPAVKWAYTVTTSYNSVTLPYSVSGETWEDVPSVKISYPRFQAAGTNKNILVEKIPNTNDLVQTISVTSNNYTQDFAYSATGIEDLYLLSEAENLGTGIPTNATSFTSRVSNGLIIYASSGTLINLPTGSYKFTLGMIGGDGGTHTTYYTVSAGANSILSTSCNGNMLALATSKAFTVSEPTDITFTCSDPNSSRGIDLIYIEQLATTTVNINATSNLASFSSSQAATVPDDVTIYIATAADAINGISLTKLAGKVIPANTGVLLYSATTGDQTLIYTGTSTDDFSTNILKATNDGTYTSTGSEYALIKGEQNFAQVQSGIVIPSNKAYVTIPGAGAKLSINFDQATSITNLNAGVGYDSATSYNLSGQKVNASYKGIIIKNGKKYIAR